MKRSRKVVPIKARPAGMTGRDGAIDFAAKDFAAKPALLHHEITIRTSTSTA